MARASFLLAIAVSACSSSHQPGVDSGSTARDAGSYDAGADAFSVDAGGSPACDLTGDWSGTRSDVSLGGSIPSPLALRFTQTGGTFVVEEQGTLPATGAGAIIGSAIEFHTGAWPLPDYSTNTYTATVSPACDQLDGEWWAYEMAHGPLLLRRR